MRKIFYIILIISLIFFFKLIFSFTNPIYAYCISSGYNYQIEYINGTQIQLCCVNNNTCFNAVYFYEGLEGLNYSYCYKLGYNATIINLPYNSSIVGCIVNGKAVPVFYFLSNYSSIVLQGSQIPNITSPTCSSIIQCPYTPWLVPQCQNINYPCFNPPHVLPGYNATLLREEICNNNSNSWYSNPYGVNLTEEYLEAVQNCPTHNVTVNCYGGFICNYNTNNFTQNEYINTLNNITIIKNQTIQNNNYYILAIILIIFLAIGIILYYKK